MTRHGARRYLLRVIVLAGSSVLIAASFLLLVIQNERHPAAAAVAAGIGVLGLIGWVVGLADSWVVAIRSRTTDEGVRPWFGFGGSVAEEQIRQSSWKVVDESSAILQWDGRRVRLLLRSSVLVALALFLMAVVVAAVR